MTPDQHGEQLVKHLGDIASGGLVVASLTGAMPAIAALLSIVWTGIRIYETVTVRRARQAIKDRLAKLRAQKELKERSGPPPEGK